MSHLWVEYEYGSRTDEPWLVSKVGIIGQFMSSNENSPLLALVRDPNLRRRVVDWKLNDFPPELALVSLTLPPELGTVCEAATISRVDDENTDHPFEISFEFRFDAGHWKQPWSIAEYVDAFRTALARSGLSGGHWKLEDPYAIAEGFDLVFYLHQPHEPIRNVISRYAPAVLQVHASAEESLLGNNTHTLIAYFDFPEEISFACEQYLLYFAQFLSDLGVKARLELKRHAGEVLVAVTPSEGLSLDTIRDVLSIYLQLPVASELSPVTSADNEVPIRRLIANIQHLRSQLMLVNTHLQSEKVAGQRNVPSAPARSTGELLPDALRQVTERDDRTAKEELLGGAIMLGQYDFFGVHLNWAEIFRKLRKRLIRSKLPENQGEKGS